MSAHHKIHTIHKHTPEQRPDKQALLRATAAGARERGADCAANGHESRNLQAAAQQRLRFKMRASLFKESVGF